MSAGCSPSPLTHLLVWKHSGGLAPLRSGLSAQADLLPRKVFCESSLEGRRIIYWANHNTLKTLPLGKLTFLALEATLVGNHVNVVRFVLCGISFPGSLLYFLKKAEPLHVSWLRFDFLWIQGAPDAAAFPVVWRNVLAICYKSLYFFRTSSFQWEDKYHCWFSVTLSEVGEGVLSLVLTLVWEQPSRSTRRFPVVPAWEGAGSTRPSWAACLYLPSQTFV